MYGLTKKEKLEFVLKTIDEKGYSAYDIAKNTYMTIAGVQRILDGSSKNPQENSLDAIMKFLIEKQTGSEYNVKQTVNQVNDSAEIEYDINYEKENRLLTKQAMKYMQEAMDLLIENVKLKRILDKNNIEY